MSGAGIIFSGQCEEKLMRAYVGPHGASEARFTDAAKKRLCTEQGKHVAEATRDDLALTQL